MLEIKFHPDSDKQEFIEGAKEYQDIWDKEGAKIVETMERISGLKFTEKVINAITFEGISRRYPLCLRSSYSHEIKKATLIHELGHRLLTGNGIVEAGDPKTQALKTHKCLNLILYDIWEELYGEEFAKRSVEVEWHDRPPFYKEAWDWALSFDKKTRQAEFTGLVI